MSALTLTLPEHLARAEVLRVALVGCGATGSECADMLYRMDAVFRATGAGMLDVSLYDGDTVEAHNVGKQRFWAMDIGRNKATALATRYNLAAGLTWADHSHRADTDVLADHDIVITAVDNAAYRCDLGEAWLKGKGRAAVWIDLGVGGHEGQFVAGVRSDPIHAPCVYALYRDSLRATAEAEQDTPPTGCSSVERSLSEQSLFINQWLSTYAGSWLHDFLTRGVATHHGGFFDLATGSATPLTADIDVWASLGYAPEAGA